MAKQTDPALRKSVIYELYIRSHTPEGTFLSVIEDLDRIRALGVDIIWLMPVHPIGVENKKGSLGCPYANRDYRTVNPEYGTLGDFFVLVDAIQARGMKCIIDVVYNHTSPDSSLVFEHPEFFYYGSDGKRGNKVGDWTDVVDLDYNARALWDYQIRTLCYWAQYVDGFRCDVASTVPVEFWLAAREAVEAVRPGAIWLGESVFVDHIRAFREQGHYAATDGELYDAFDILYPYDLWPLYDACTEGRIPLSHYFDAINFQELSFPPTYNKLRCIENHDQPRAAHRFTNEVALLAWTALSYFMKGTAFLYAGQEFCATHTPSLFEREPIARQGGRDISAYLAKLAAVKKQLPTDAAFHIDTDDAQGIVTAYYTSPNAHAFGAFLLSGNRGTVPVYLPDGTYIDRISEMPVVVENGKLTIEKSAILIV